MTVSEPEKKQSRFIAALGLVGGATRLLMGLAGLVGVAMVILPGSEPQTTSNSVSTASEVAKLRAIRAAMDSFAPPLRGPHPSFFAFPADSNSGTGSAEDRFKVIAHCSEPRPGQIRGMVEGDYSNPFQRIQLVNAAVFLRREGEEESRSVRAQQYGSFFFDTVRTRGRYFITVMDMRIAGADGIDQLTIGELSDLQAHCILPSEVGRVTLSRLRTHLADSILAQ
jgi:hypothetical protein